MTFLFIAIPVCVVAIFGTVGVVTLYEGIFGESMLERDKKIEASHVHERRDNSPGINQEMESWLREVDAMERF